MTAGAKAHRLRSYSAKWPPMPDFNKWQDQASRADVPVALMVSLSGHAGLGDCATTSSFDRLRRRSTAQFGLAKG